MARRPEGRIRRPPGRAPFDAVTDLYDRVRPGYPDDAVDDLLRLTSTPPRGDVLEVGAGTGQLSVAIAERGYRLTAVEIGPHLAQRLERNLHEYDDAEVVQADFEQIDLRPRSVDLVAAAMSFHWLDRTVAYRQAARVLRPTGSLGLIFNIHVDADTGYFAASDDVYTRLAPDIHGPGTGATVAKQSAWRSEIDETGLFGEVVTARHPWSVTYSRKTYLELLSTYSDHIRLEPDVAAALYAELGRLIDREFGGKVEKHYEALVVATPVLPGGGA